MMKYFSWGYVKAHPVMFGMIIIVFGLILFMLINRRGGSAGQNTVVTNGKTDAQVAAEMQMGMAQLGAQTQLQVASLGANVELARLNAQIAAGQDDNDTALALAGLGAQLSAAQIAAQERMTNRSTDASLSALNMQLQNAYASQVNNNQFAYDYAKLAYDSSIETVKTNAALTATLSAQQLDAYKYGTDAAIKQNLIGQIGSLKKKDRDESLQIISGNILGNPVPYYNGPGSAIVYGGVPAQNSMTTH